MYSLTKTLLLLSTLLITNACSYIDFSNFKKEYNKLYSDNKIDENHFKTYCNNVEFIDNFNSQNNSYELGINQFTDLNHKEFKSYNSNNLINIKNKSHNHIILEKPDSILESFDWRDQGKVTNVKDQGQCGSCWAFSALGSLESTYAIHSPSHNLYNLSEQELVDCSSKDEGCDGGLMDDAFQYIMDNGICSYKRYPYIAEDNKCSKANCSRVVNISRFVDVKPNSETQLLYALLINPISVAIDASDPSFQSYKRGIYNGSCSTTLDHGVTLIGYGYDTVWDSKYWIIKNSWATTWGDNGYMYMLRDIEDTSGLCGIAMDASYPIV